MSDTFREQLVTRYRAAALRVTKDELHDVLKEYDATAPDRDRAAKAVGAFEEALKWDDSTTCYECPFRPICWMGGRRTDLCTRLVGFGRERGILPEGAHREAE